MHNLDKCNNKESYKKHGKQSACIGWQSQAVRKLLGRSKHQRKEGEEEE
jgi:hypothetical protein